MISRDRLKVACERAEMRGKSATRGEFNDTPGDFGIRLSEWGPLLRELESSRYALRWFYIKTALAMAAGTIAGRVLCHFVGLL